MYDLTFFREYIIPRAFVTEDPQQGSNIKYLVQKPIQYSQMNTMDVIFAEKVITWLPSLNSPKNSMGIFNHSQPRLPSTKFCVPSTYSVHKSSSLWHSKWLDIFTNRKHFLKASCSCTWRKKIRASEISDAANCLANSVLYCRTRELND